jgi:hypothetical protein
MNIAPQFDLSTVCPGLALGEDEISYASAGEAISYPEEGEWRMLKSI